MIQSSPPLPRRSNLPGSTARSFRASCRTSLLLVACLLSGGCSFFSSEPEQQNADLFKSIETQRAEPNDEGGPAEKVRFDGGLLLGDTDNLAYTPQSLAPVITNLVHEEKWQSLKNTVRTYPDVILKLIVGADGKTIAWADTQTTARVFDQLWKSRGADSWQQFVEQLANRDNHATSLIAKRAQFLQFLGNNQPSRALSLKLERHVDGRTAKLVQVEVMRLEGIAHLMLENYDQSIESFSKAIQLANSQTFLTSQIALLLGEAQRHAGQHDAWKQTWQSAIIARSKWTVERGLNDPAFWKKAAFLRPVDAEWPTEVIDSLTLLLERQGLDFSDRNVVNNEAVVWATVGLQSLNRHESQNAILAFKKAESLVRNRTLSEELQMQQALAMIDGGTPGPASAILIRLGSGQNLLADRAKAILATLKLSGGSLAQGMNLLQSAIKTSAQWPTGERLKAEADFGLALLMRGREEEGVALLNQVHQEFLANDLHEHASQCIWNLAKY